MIKSIQLILLLILFFVTVSVQAEDNLIRLEQANIDPHDSRSVQKGAKNFATYCLVCHSLDLMAHDPIAKSAGITPEKMPDKNQKWWFGVSPPDLSLIARVYSADWLYTYLHVFYKDPSKHIASNNLLIDNVNMPNPFIGIQGEQVLLYKKEPIFRETWPFTRKVPYFSVLQLTRAGSMSPDDFDNMIRDLVNFLVYASEPKKYAREKLGIWVLLFIVILFIFIYLLKREYWKRLKK